MIARTNEDDARAIAELLRAGREADARGRVAQALAAGRETDAVLAFAGMLAARGGDMEAAARHWSKLLSQRPDDRATRLNLVAASIALERFAEARALLEGQPGDAVSDRLLAYAAMRSGDLLLARDAYRSVLKAQRDDADSWANLASVEADLGEIPAAIRALEEAITLSPADHRFYLALTGVLERADRPVARLKVARDAAVVAPKNPAVQVALGLAAAAADEVAVAETAFRAAILLAPDDPAAYLELGLLFEGRNRLSDLAKLVDQAATRIGDELSLLRSWAAFRAGRLDEANRLAQNIPTTVQALRRHQLRAQIAERRGDAGAAFVEFERMNAEAVATAPAYDGPSYRQVIERETEALRQVLPRQRVAYSDDDAAAPIFVTGFPRSGTTLIDTLLGQLPGAVVLEERSFLPTLQRQVGDGRAVAALDAATVSELRDRYRAAVVAEYPEAAGGRLIDKHPLHMTRMSLIERLFPGAPILLVERHPYDVVLSCFMANFRLNHAMRSFTDIEEAALTYDAVFTAWEEAERRLQLNVHRIRYERLVTYPESEMRAAVAHVGAAFNERLLDNVDAVRKRGHIRTASYAQVTEPIYQRAVARWRRYRTQLAPVIPILAPWAERMGYDT